MRHLKRYDSDQITAMIRLFYEGTSLRISFKKTDNYIPKTNLNSSPIDFVKDKIDIGELIFSSCWIKHPNINDDRTGIMVRDIIKSFLNQNEYGLSVILDILEDHNVFSSQITISGIDYHTGSEEIHSVVSVEIPIPGPDAALDIINICKKG